MIYKTFFLSSFFVFFLFLNCNAAVKPSEFGGQFYPDQKEELTSMVDNFLKKAEPKSILGNVFMLISPHAGYGYSGQTAAFGYKLIKGKPYKTVIILGANHHKDFSGAVVYDQGAFTTSLGRIEIDEEFVKTLRSKGLEIFMDQSYFNNEHSIEVQLPFLQQTLSGFKIVPVIVGDCSLDACKNIARLLNVAIGERGDVLVVVSTDLYHGYDFEEAVKVDAFTLELIKKLDYEGLYYALRDQKAQACGGFALVTALRLAKARGSQAAEVLSETDSVIVTGRFTKGEWVVGYASVALVDKGENMLDIQQRNKLLKISREAIETYLKTNKKLQITENDPLLNQEMGCFVTLNKNGNLRGCIGNLTGSQPLYLMVRDMAVEAAVGDSRFAELSLAELNEIRIEISVLSPLKRIASADDIELGKHGVLIRKDMQGGVFLPQVATETGWSKEEFLNNLCTQKAGLPSGAWRDKATEIYIFSAEVFSEKEH